jgi:hypothetical protein
MTLKIELKKNKNYNDTVKTLLQRYYKIIKNTLQRMIIVVHFQNLFSIKCYKDAITTLKIELKKIKITMTP